MKCLITGGAGFIGSYITKELITRGDEVIIVDALLNYISPFIISKLVFSFLKSNN